MSMTLSVEEAATLLRLSARTVRARLQRGELNGHKEGGQWRLPRAALPLTADRHRQLQDRAEAVRRVVDAALPSRAPSEQPQRRHIADLHAFRAAAALLVELRAVAGSATVEPVARRSAEVAVLRLEAALEGIGRAWPLFAPQQRLGLLDGARSEVGGAAAWLASCGDPACARLAARLEDEVLPPLAGMCRSADQRGAERRRP
jgi:excisionase family DNA binding protein